MAIPNKLKVALSETRPLLGVWMQLGHPAVAEMMGLLGYDVVLIDMKHGPGSLGDTGNMLRGVQRSSVPEAAARSRPRGGRDTDCRIGGGGAPLGGRMPLPAQGKSRLGRRRRTRGALSA